jgi:hypothetical protein
LSAEPRSALEAAAEQADWTIERDAAIVVGRDVWTKDADHAAWLVASEGWLAAGASHRLAAREA